MRQEHINPLEDCGQAYFEELAKKLAAQAAAQAADKAPADANGKGEVAAVPKPPVATQRVTTPERTPYLIDAADLLAKPDPGPTRWLIEGLMVDQALIAAVGRWKTTKSYGMLEMSISVNTGFLAFGSLAIPEPGPVVFVIEESGEAALYRRLDALRRGRGIDRERLRGLHFAPNQGVRLDDLEWQKRLIEDGQRIRPRLFVFDPLARVKSAAREENKQTDMALVIEFWRQLREKTGAAVALVHHTGHSGDQMRGSSDLESAWETRLTWKRDGTASIVQLSAEHREAESSPTITYGIGWDEPTRTPVRPAHHRRRRPA
jgi:RecA-family ATPase